MGTPRLGIFGTDLTAYRMPVPFWIASRTTPKLPAPITLPMMYLRSVGVRNFARYAAEGSWLFLICANVVCVQLGQALTAGLQQLELGRLSGEPTRALKRPSRCIIDILSSSKGECAEQEWHGLNKRCARVAEHSPALQISVVLEHMLQLVLLELLFQRKLQDSRVSSAGNVIGAVHCHHAAGSLGS